MKNILIAGLIFGVSFSVQAKVDKKDVEESVCRGMMDYAEMAMEHRQDGVPLSASLKIIDKMRDEGKYPDAHLDMLKFLTVEAHSKPKFSVKENQKEAINEFGSEQYIACMKHFSKK